MKKHLKKHFNFLLFFVVLFGGYLLWSEFIQEESITMGSGEVPIMSEFADKIVYTSSADADTQKLKADCDKRNGRFNECGNICSTGTSVCAEVCAYTCELNKANNLDKSWKLYKSYYYGFSIPYPREMKVNDSSADKRVSFSLFGPGQAEEDEMLDGIKIDIISFSSKENIDLETLAKQDYAKQAETSETLDPVRAIEINGNKGYSFRMKSAFASTRYFIAKDNKHFFVIMTSAPDPAQLGYHEIVNHMINSFQPISAD